MRVQKVRLTDDDNKDQCLCFDYANNQVFGFRYSHESRKMQSFTIQNLKKRGEVSGFGKDYLGKRMTGIK